MSRTLRLLFALWVVLAGTAGSPEPCFADAPVTLRPTTEVHGMIVRLSDVFTGIPADVDQPIARAPAPGKQVTYDVDVLRRLADKYQLDWKPDSIADHVVVTTACSQITADMLRAAVVAKIKDLRSSGGQKNHGGVEVAFDNRMMDIDLPADHMPDYSLNNFEYDPQSKRFRTDLVAQLASGPYSVPVSGHVTLMRTIPVLARQLEAGTVIAAADLDTIDVPEDRINDSVISNAGELIGRELRRDTDSGEMLHTHDVVPPRCVTRGGLVLLKVQTPFMLLTAQGKAMQDGAQGDVVRVMNTQSNRVIEGVVEGPGVVRIQTAQRLAEAQ